MLEPESSWVKFKTHNLEKTEINLDGKCQETDPNKVVKFIIGSEVRYIDPYLSTMNHSCNLTNYSCCCYSGQG